MSAGDRGKWAEGKVRAQLEQRNSSSEFAYYRLPDARAGSYQPTLSDFLVLDRGTMHLLEVKEVNHTHRLPGKNFATDKRSRIHKMVMAGSESLVIVCFSPLREQYTPREQTHAPIWRAADIAWFGYSDVPSWDMFSLPLRPLQAILEEYFA